MTGHSNTNKSNLDGAVNKTKEQLNYRDRLYTNYVTSHVGRKSDDFIHKRQPYLRSLVHRHFPNNKAAKILDLGCGYGALIDCAQKAGYQNIIGVDASPEQTEFAKKLGIQSVRLGDMMETICSAENQEYDMIISFDVIEHLDRNEILDLADQVFRALKSEGEWLIHTPNAASPFFGRVRFGDFTHEIAFTQASIAQVLSVCGFEQFDFYEDKPIIHGVKSFFRRILWQFFSAFYKLSLAAETGVTQEILSQNFITIAKK